MTLEVKEYNEDFEFLMIQYMLTDPDLYVRSRSIIKPQYFENKIHKQIVEFFEDYSERYGTLPKSEEIKALYGKEIKPIENITEKNKSFYFEQIESFCRHIGLEHAVLESVPLLENKNYGEIERIVKNAVQIGLVKDLGIDYFDNPEKRIKEMLDRSNMITTGWKELDHHLYGGIERGTLNIVAGQSGSGKSLILQNLAVNWVNLGFNVVYLSLELSEKLCALRIDAMVSGYGTKEVTKNLQDVALRVGATQKKTKGSLRIKQLPNGCTANDIRAYIKEYEQHSNRRVDAILVDYLDLCMPVRKGISPTDMFVKDKYVSEELRNLAIELNVLMFTASQLNRSSHDEVEFGHQHISGGISKINTADNVMAIYVTPALKEAGKYQIQLIKTRSSAGVGNTITLNFNISNLRLSDADPNDVPAAQAVAKNLINDLRKKSVITNNNVPPPEQEKNTSTKSSINSLRDLIRKDK